MNNLDAEVAENPHELVVYGGIGRAARDGESFDRSVEALKRLEGDETLLVQSGKPVGIFRTHENAPRVLIANSNLVPHWATWEHFQQLDRAGLMMRSEEHTSELQSLMRSSYAVFCLKKKNTQPQDAHHQIATRLKHENTNE